MSFFVLLYRVEVVVPLLLLKSKGGLQKVAVVVFRAFLVILMIDLEVGFCLKWRKNGSINPNDLVRTSASFNTCTLIEIAAWQ